MERDCYKRKRDERNARESGYNDDEYNSESYTVIASISTARASTLPHVQADLCILKGSTVRALVLVDSGSTHSFIAPHLLGKKNLMLLDRNPDFFPRQPLSLKGVNGLSKPATCVLAEATVKIGDWCGKHTFIVTTAMDSQQAILGFDFMRQHNVTLSYGSNGMDTMQIDNVKMKISSQSFDSSASSETTTAMSKTQESVPYFSASKIVPLLILESEHKSVSDEQVNQSREKSNFSVSLNNTIVSSSSHHTGLSSESSKASSPLPDKPLDSTTVPIYVLDDAIGSARVLQSTAKLKSTARHKRAVEIDNYSVHENHFHAYNDAFDKINSYAYERPFVKKAKTKKKICRVSSKAVLITNFPFQLINLFNVCDS
jgi:hypothetical protein